MADSNGTTALLCAICGKTDGSIFAGERNSLPAFQAFLRKLESRQGLLPSWWNEQKKAECIALGMNDAADWSSLETAPDIVEHYGDSRMPMQMRMLGEMIYGRGPGGQDGTMMLIAMKHSEAGGFGVLETRHLDMSRFSNRP